VNFPFICSNIPAAPSSYKPGDKSWMRKGPGIVYDKWNISVVICDTDIPCSKNLMKAVCSIYLWYPELLSSPPVFSGVRVTRSLVLYACFVDRCLSFCTFPFGNCVVCSSIYGFWFPLRIFKLFLH
jgi:hypothetical protein